MGIANVFSLIALLAFSTTDALIVVVCRCILGAIFQGNVSAVLYSLTGGITSILLCAVLVRLLYPKISVLAMIYSKFLLVFLRSCVFRAGMV